MGLFFCFLRALQPTKMTAAPSTTRVLALDELTGHIRAWNATPPMLRARLLSATFLSEAAAFVAATNALEGIPPLVVADMLTLLAPCS